jgi:lysophospholipase L1-like esterase
VALFATAADARERPRPAPPSGWVASWGSAQMVPDAANALPADRATAVTLRQIVRLSAGGARIRVRLSNAFGTVPLAIGAAHLAHALAPGTPRTDTGVPLTFAGSVDAVIAPGAEIYSDPVAWPATAGADIAVSLYLASAPLPQTGHPGARATSFTLPGRHVADPALAGAMPITRWYALADVEVAGAGAAGTVVAIGDSITDGYGVQPERNTRWTDVFAARLRARVSTRGIGVVNAGIGGNRVLLDGTGPNLLARFDRDVIARSGVRWSILLEGINDLGVLTRDAPATPAQHAAIVAQVIAGYRQVVARAHAHGIRVIGGTVTPFGGNGYYHPGPASEADRQAINAFIRRSGLFDAVIDFDRLLRDPAQPDRLNPAYDSGDHLHPSEAGYRAMGEAVPLTLFGAGTTPDEAPAIALTFDDIPVHGALPPGVTRAGIVRAITAALKRAKAPAFGFLNAGPARDDPTGAEAVAAWRAAGLPLGNHGYAHLDLAKVGATVFLADAVRNEAPLAAAAGKADWHWFRYPFLSEGTTAAVTDAVRAGLKARGYRVAAVTMGFNDFAWSAPYAACAARGDRAAIALLEQGFLADARTAAMQARASALARVGRDIPYVLLMHVGAFDAHMLPRLLALYREMGFRFVTLPAAQADPFYAAAQDLSLPGPSPSLPGATLAGPAPDLCSR